MWICCTMRYKEEVPFLHVYTCSSSAVWLVSDLTVFHFTWVVILRQAYASELTNARNQAQGMVVVRISTLLQTHHFTTAAILSNYGQQQELMVYGLLWTGEYELGSWPHPWSCYRRLSFSGTSSGTTAAFVSPFPVGCKMMELRSLWWLLFCSLLWNTQICLVRDPSWNSKIWQLLKVHGQLVGCLLQFHELWFCWETHVWMTLIDVIGMWMWGTGFLISCHHYATLCFALDFSSLSFSSLYVAALDFPEFMLTICC